MKKPLQEHLDIPDDDEEQLVIDGPGPRPATQTLAALAVEAALTRTARRRIESGRPIAVVVQTPSAAWVAPVQRAMQRRWGWTHVVAEAAPKPFRRSLTDRSETAAASLAQGGRVLGISPAPERLLPPGLVAGADLRFAVSATPAVLSRAIQMATGCRPRSVPADLGSGLDFLELASAIRNSTSAASCVRRLQEATRALSRLDPALADVPLLSELNGYGAAVMTWAFELVADLSSSRRGQEIRLSEHSAVVAGPPGCGKTTLVRSIAKTAGLPLVASSPGQWFADSGGHLDDVIKEVAKMFSTGPAVILLDELDGIPDRRTLSGRGADWWSPVIGFLLTMLDGAVSSSAHNFIVIGATNLPERLDPALTRPGRLNRVIHIDPPDERAVAGILRQHLGSDLAGVDLAPLARLAGGSSGAALAANVKAARRSARQAGRAMSFDDLLLEVAPDDDRSAAALWRSACHEAGHAVLCRAIGLGNIEAVSILRRPGSGGSLTVNVPEDLTTRDALERHVIVSLAGRAAERVLIGSVSTGAGGSIGSDLAKASAYLAAMHASFGLGATPLFRAPVDKAGALLASDPDLRRVVQKDLVRLEQRALDLVRTNRGLVERVNEKGGCASRAWNAASKRAASWTSSSSTRPRRTLGASSTTRRVSRSVVRPSPSAST